jgi:hypothetical protein
MSKSRARLRLVLLPALLLAVLPVAASGSTGFEQVGAVTLDPGEDVLVSAVIDPDGTHAYFGTNTALGTNTTPGQVVKVNLATMQRVGAVTLEPGEDRLWSAVSDGTHAYFGTYTEPGRVVKVNLATMQRVEAVTLEPGEGFLYAAVSDGTHAYFGTRTSPGRVVKVNLATMQRVEAVTLEPGENQLASAVSDGTHAYFGTNTAPGRVVKVNLATMQRVEAVTLEPGEDRLASAVSDGTHAYFGTETEPGRVVKVNLATMQRVGAVTLELGEDQFERGPAVVGLLSAVSDGTDAYFAWSGGPNPVRVVKVNLATMQQVGAVTLDVRGYSYSAVSDGTHVYFGMRTFPGRVVKLGASLAVRAAPAAAVPPSVSCVPLLPVVGATVTCTVTGGDAGIDILWRAAYNPVFAGEGVTLDASGSGEFSFTVPAAALGEELTVELVEWIAPVSLGVVGGPVPSSVPSGEGPVPVWSLAVLALAGLLLLLLRRGMRAEA